MRTWQALLLIPAALVAQPPQSTALLQGILLERDTQTPTGEFSVRATDNHVFRYRFDENTSADRDQLASSIARLEPGDKVEVISDDGPAASLRYAHAVHVLESAPSRQRIPQSRFRSYRLPQEREIANATLTYAGVISRLNAERMVLHTRGGGEQTILLRQDTRYLGNGEVVEPGELRTNMRVFVRAGHTLFNEVEAYQVVWGQILLP